MFQNFPVSKSWDKKSGVEGSIMIFFQKFLSHSANKFRWGNFLCFRNSMFPKNSMDKRGGCGDCHDFSSENFCCTVPKKLVAESFSVSFFPGIEKIYALERFLMIFLSKVLSHSTKKNFVWEPFSVSEFFRY